MGARSGWEIGEGREPCLVTYSGSLRTAGGYVWFASEDGRSRLSYKKGAYRIWERAQWKTTVGMCFVFSTRSFTRR